MQDALYHKFNFLSFVVSFDPDFLFGFVSGVSGFVVESVQILIISLSGLNDPHLSLYLNLLSLKFLPLHSHHFHPTNHLHPLHPFLV